MALTELCGRIPVQLQRHRQRRLRVRTQRAVARSRRCRLGNAAHPDRMVITARQQRSPRRRTQRGGVETVVRQTTRREPVRRRRTTRTTERARRAETDIIEQDDQNVRRTLRRQQGLDRRERSVRVLRVIGRQTRRWPVRDGQHRACMSVGTHRFLQMGGLEGSAAPSHRARSPGPTSVACRCRRNEHPDRSGLRWHKRATKHRGNASP